MSAAPWRLFVAVPAQAQSLSVQTASTLLSLQAAAGRLGWRFEAGFFSGALLPDLRNLIVRDFLLRGADGLLMLDSDQGCSAEMVVRMIQTGHPVVGCMSPRRRYFFDQVRPEESCADMQRVLHQASRYVGELALGPDGRSFDMRDGFARARFVGAGVLLIRREAIDRLKGRFPELEGQGLAFSEVQGDTDQENWGFFNLMTDPEQGCPLSEDYAFCHRWRVGCGGELWAEIVTPVTHVGPTSFQGAYLDHLRAVYATDVKAAQADPSP